MNTKKESGSTDSATPNSAPQDKARPSVGLLRASSTVGSMTLLSRILGFLRDMVVARLFGADAATDAFFVAFKIPNFFRRLFAEGAFSQAFVPVFAEYKEHKDFNALKDLVNHIAGCLGGLLLLVATIGVTAAPLVLLLFAPGFADEPERYELASSMLRLTFPYLFFISLVALAGSILNSYGRFAVPAFTPALLNITLISCAIWLSPQLEVPVMALAWGALFAGIAQLAFQIPFLLRLKLLPRPRWRWQHSGVQKVVKLMLPAILGSAVVQINLLLDTVIASLLVAGSVSWLYFADRLVEFPLGVFGIAVATVILPSLSRKHASQNSEAFSKNLDWALRLTLVISLPAMLGLMLLAGPALTTLFQYGEFSAVDTRMATVSLVAYAVGLPAFILVKVLAPGFFARQDTKTPVKIGIRAMLLNMVFNIILVVTLLYTEWAPAHAGLALATALSAWAQAGMLYRRLRQEQVYQPQQGWSKLFLQLLPGLSLMVAGLLYFTPSISQWMDWNAWQRAWQLTLLIASAGIGYFVLLWLAGIRLKHFRNHS